VLIKIIKTHDRASLFPVGADLQFVPTIKLVMI